MTVGWTFGGTALSTFGKVAPLSDNWDIPARRGNNQVIPFRDGSIHVPKFWDQRIITIGIAMTAATASALETALDSLNQLIALRTEQTLAWTREDTSVRNISASVNRPLQSQRLGPYLCKVVLEFTCSKPYWRSNTETDVTTTINASPKTFTLTNPGTVQERDATLVIDGPFTVLAITNTTTGAVLTYTGSIGSSETVTIGTNASGEYYATLSTGSANVINNLTHSGDTALMTFNPGNNSMSVAPTGGDNSGTLRIHFFAPFL